MSHIERSFKVCRECHGVVMHADGCSLLGWILDAPHDVVEFVPAEQLWAVQANLDTLRQALIDMDEAICHGNPATARRIARDAFAITAETGSTLRN